MEIVSASYISPLFPCFNNYVNILIPERSLEFFLTTSQNRTNCNIPDNRGDETLEERSENLTLTDLGAESQQNLSCAGVNSVGEGGI